MKLIYKIILIVIVVVISISLVRFIQQFKESSSCMMDPIVGNDDKYLWMFQASHKNQWDSFYSFGNNGSNDFLYGYTFNDKRVVIWELNEFKNMEDSIQVNKNVDLSHVEIMPSAVSKLGGGPNVKIESQICFPKISRISVNLGSESELINKVYHSNYCQLTGTIDKVGIINEYGEYQILLTFDIPQFTHLLFYKSHGKMYLLLINASNEKSADEVVNMLNLD